MSMKRLFVEMARTELNTPFHHQGRASKTGLDCIGLLVISALKCGIELHDFITYKRRPDGRLLSILRNHPQLKEREIEDLEEGDICVFNDDKTGLPWHVAIKTNIGLIHAMTSFASKSTKKVVEHEFTDKHEKALCAVFELRDL